jgi:putative transcriptional regulator
VTTMDVRDLLPLHALGLLDEEESAAVERAAAADPVVRAELAAYRDAGAVLGTSLTPREPSRAVWDRLLHSIGAGRFERFTGPISRLFDVSFERARELLGWIDDPARWEDFKPGAWLLHFPAGPACAGADTGFVKVTAGAAFPWHAHGGEEVTLVLQGAGRDSDGVVHGVGDQWAEPAGSRHEFAAEPGEDYIFAVRVLDVDFDVQK